MNNDKIEINGVPVEIKDGTIEYFACTCLDEKELFWELAIEEYQQGFDVDELADIVSQLTADLCWNYGGYITSIYMDQWFLVTAKTSQYNFSIQCDQLQYGFMALIKILQMLDKSVNND